MTKQEELKGLYEQYVEKFDWDFHFIAFFDENNKIKLDEKIKLLKKSIKQERLFTSFEGAYDLFDNYLTDIEEAGGNWTLLT